MKSVFYWSPFLTNVATIQAVIKSATSLSKYSKNYDISIINASGEFNKYENFLNKKNIKIINLYKFNYHKHLPSQGFILSRLSFLIIFIFSILPLFFLIKSQKPDYFICHLITALPILLSRFLKKTKFILRISGLPNYTFFRKILWRFLGKNLYAITCPTKATYDDLKNLNLFNINKLLLLRDPVIEMNKLQILKKEEININFNAKDFNIFCVGRLTEQKNFKLIINNFHDFLRINKNSKLFIIGHGEQQKLLHRLINENNLSKNVFLLGYQKNIFKFLYKANLFILASKWEDPGWVLIEAALCNTLILSSNCKNGPKELIENDQGGVLFENNSEISLLRSFKKINNLSNNEVYKMKLFAKKKTKYFTIFNHFVSLSKILV